MAEAKTKFPEFKYVDNSYEAAKNADVLVLMIKWNQYRAFDFDKIKSLMKGLIFVDLRNVYSPEKIRKYGFIYVGVGW